jgi:hypothetical protein
MLYAFFWVIPRRLNFICRCFGTLCLFHLHRRVGVRMTSHSYTYLPMKMGQCVPQLRHIKFRRRGITQKKACNIQNTVKVWNQECFDNRNAAVCLHLVFYILRITRDDGFKAQLFRFLVSISDFTEIRNKILWNFSKLLPIWPWLLMRQSSIAVQFC